MIITHKYKDQIIFRVFRLLLYVLVFNILNFILVNHHFQIVLLRLICVNIAFYVFILKKNICTL